jgi:hypothetical protein
MRFAGQPTFPEQIEEHIRLSLSAVGDVRSEIIDVSQWPGVQCMVGPDAVTRVSLEWFDDPDPTMAGMAMVDPFEQGRWVNPEHAMWRVPTRLPFLRVRYERLDNLTQTAVETVVQRYDGPAAWGGDAMHFAGMLGSGAMNIGNGASGIIIPMLNPFFGPAAVYADLQPGGFGSSVKVQVEDPLNTGTYISIAGSDVAAGGGWTTNFWMPAKRARVQVTNVSGAAFTFRASVMAPPFGRG